MARWYAVPGASMGLSVEDRLYIALTRQLHDGQINKFERDAYFLCAVLVDIEKTDLGIAGDKAANALRKIGAKVPAR